MSLLIHRKDAQSNHPTSIKKSSKHIHIEIYIINNCFSHNGNSRVVI